MKRWLLRTLGALGIVASLGPPATACPLCLSDMVSTTAQKLIHIDRAVLALPAGDGTRLRIVEVIKGEGRPGDAIAASQIIADAAAVEALPVAPARFK